MVWGLRTGGGTLSYSLPQFSLCVQEIRNCVWVQGGMGKLSLHRAKGWWETQMMLAPFGCHLFATDQCLPSLPNQRHLGYWGDTYIHIFIFI